MFQRVAGQVIVAGMGECLGIKFEAIETIFNIYGITDPEERLELFEKIQSVDLVRSKFRKDEMIRQQQKSKTPK